ncbi:hypothetical protein 65p345 [Aeromonas phage 65]|uniref:Uncharacterized protein n=2 Tax=Ishigurovirus osborne TaxID=260149 RepID=A0A219YDC6_9CAUD|nr:hypothetical protein ST65p345 [Aeromonas phage 65]ADQ53353.1 hypothetical protein 65p345 [Aeromonas phage 65]APU01713.1 hypothetical protein [Aeromonas phage 65.2]
MFYFYNENGRWNEHGVNMLIIIENYINEKYNNKNIYKEDDVNLFLSELLSLSYIVTNNQIYTDVIQRYVEKYKVDFTIDELVLIELQVRDMVIGCISESASTNRLMRASRILKSKKNIGVLK